MGKRLRLSCPKTFNEKIQWLKINDRNPLYTTLADKIAMKEYLLPIVGKEHLIDTLGVWKNAQDIDFSLLPDKFVIKCNHDSGSVIICKDKGNFDEESARKSLSKSLSRNFFDESREWIYKDIEPMILAEPYLGDNLIDYKFYCFNGEPRFLYVSQGLSDHSNASMIFMNMDWTEAEFKRTDFKHMDQIPQKPKSFEMMCQFARSLSQGMRFVRIDLYEIEGIPKISEITFYPNGGMMKFASEEMDLKMGEYLCL